MATCLLLLFSNGVLLEVSQGLKRRLLSPLSLSLTYDIESRRSQYKQRRLGSVSVDRHLGERVDGEGMLSGGREIIRVRMSAKGSETLSSLFLLNVVWVLISST
jgi:hypothetical protein